MKKSVLLLIAVCVSFFAIAQEKVEMRLDLKDGNSVTGLVQVQSDGSYRIELPSGDVVFFSSSEVARARNVQGTLSPGEGNNNYVEKKKGKLYLQATGAELAPEDFMTFQVWERYRAAQRNIRTANTLLIVTGGMVVTGGTIAVIYALTDVEELGVIGGCLGMAAAIPAVSSLIFGISGNKKLTKIQDSYNYNHGYVVDFGAQQYGVGLALHF